MAQTTGNPAAWTLRWRFWCVCLALVCSLPAGCLRDANCARVRMATISSPTPTAQSSPPRSEPPPVIEPSTTIAGALVDEEAMAVLGARVVAATHRIPAAESRNLVAVMQDGYRRMKETDGHVPTPVPAWVIGAPADTVVIQPEEPTQDLAVVFLHGWGGSWALPCWQVAQAARQVHAMTVCPATRFEGDWWSSAGEDAARQAIRALRASGVQRVVLVGLSNGGIGASLIAPKLRGEIQGLVLISGASPQARSSGVPTLVMHGARDSMTSPAVARQYASRAGGRYVSVDGTHFALLEKHEEMTAALAGFLGSIAASRPGKSSKP
ncbi:MAG: hypothetical protein HY898_27655 [Deltaproteobacteria bacterium]|nr:hypothetical protein [Deltaproteobacteria bacterium]